MIRSYAYFSILCMAFLLICHVKSQKPVSKFAYIKKNMYLCTQLCAERNYAEKKIAKKYKEIWQIWRKSIQPK